jgi:hypothetical protein
MAQHGTSDRINDRAVVASNGQPATDSVRDGDVGAAFGAAGYALRSGRRDFTAIEHLQADSYHLLVPADVADQAAGLLSELSDQSPQREHHQPVDVR